MKVNFVLFKGFEPLDVFGPLEVLIHFPEIEVKLLSAEGGPVQSNHGVEINTEKINEESFTGALLVPGGPGTRTLAKDEPFLAMVARLAVKAEYCLTVCTGSAVLAACGFLKGIEATGNKRAFEWIRSIDDDVLWKDCARWTKDGRIYTSSGVSAGIDMALAFAADLFGLDRAREVAKQIEYLWNEDRNLDPFSGR